MSIYGAGLLNLTAQIVPDLLVVVQNPDVAPLNGVATGILGVVGTAQWGPVNSPVAIGPMADYSRQFGAIQARKYDMGTIVATAVKQRAAAFRCVRVTDGTDAAATIVVLTNCITFTSKYSGTLANGDQVRVEPGSATGTFRVTVLRAGRAPEVFDNIGAGLTGNAIWVAMANAINQGQSGLRGPSDLIVATAGVGVTAPSTATYVLAGGTDGAGVAASDLIGVDTSNARKGMYALRGSGASIAALADCDTSSTWTTQVAFGVAEGIEMVGVASAGIAIANGTTGTVDVKATAGIDNPAFKLCHGDWCYWNDPVNNVTRLVSPQGFIAGAMAARSPEVSILNKELFDIAGTQKSAANQVYSKAELELFGANGIEVITNPVPGGAYFGARFGRNSSSDPGRRQDTYTRITNYIAATLNAGMGRFVGQNQTADLRREAKATLDAFLEALQFTGMIGNAEGTRAFTVTLDETNNPSNRVKLGYMQADVRVQYLSVVEYFIVNLQGGQTVTIQRVGEPLAA